MKAATHLPDSNAEEQASLWAARLEGSTLSAADRDALDAWLAEKDAHRTLLTQYCQFSADLEKPLLELALAGAVTMPATPTPTRKRWPITWIASSVLAAAAVMIAFTLIRPQVAPANLATGIAQRSSVTLADGTRVDLNAHTNLAVEESRTERRVRLGGGEAFFAVSKDKTRPFFVETPAGTVRVTGTGFNVRAEAASELEVTVLEGSVQVRPSGPGTSAESAPFMLVPGDQLLVHAEGNVRHVLSASELDDAIAWRHGEIVFHGEPLGVALARFARYHGRSITPTAEAAALPLGGRFGLDDLGAFFDALQIVLPVTVAPDAAGALRVAIRKER